MPKKYQFKKRVFAPPFAPYYDNYRGHQFVIDHAHPDAEAVGHVWLTCVDDPSVKVDGYVEMEDLCPMKSDRSAKSSAKSSR